MPILYVLVGLPGSGKSTIVDSIIKKYNDTFVYSTDNLIEEWSAQMGWSYNMGFQKYIDKATKEMNNMLVDALKNKNNIIWDQTNLAIKKRKSIISKVGPEYKKVCVYIELSKNDLEEKILSERLNSRIGKNIPENIISNMKASFSIPTLEEGFDELVVLSLTETKTFEIEKYE